ncbi:MAG: hypothetical protein FD138_4485, partial [Planctomycetota bacterium]
MTESISATTIESSSRCTARCAWLAMALALAGTLGSLALSWG